MSRYRGVNGVARECVKRYRGVNGVSRQITKGYRGVNGVTRQYFASNPVSKAVIRVDSSDTLRYSISENSIQHTSSGDSLESLRLVLELYDVYGELIDYDDLDDVENLETFKMSVQTQFNIYYGSVSWTCDVFGINALSYESYQVSGIMGKGDFTVTESNFETPYITMRSETQGHRKITFNYLEINGDYVPLTISDY